MALTINFFDGIGRMAFAPTSYCLQLLTEDLDVSLIVLFIFVRG